MLLDGGSGLTDGVMAWLNGDGAVWFDGRARSLRKELSTGKAAHSVPLDHVISIDADELRLGGSGLLAIAIDHLEW